MNTLDKQLLNMIPSDKISYLISFKNFIIIDPDLRKSEIINMINQYPSE